MKVKGFICKMIPKWDTPYSKGYHYWAGANKTDLAALLVPGYRVNSANTLTNYIYGKHTICY